MAANYVLLEKIVVGAAGASSVTFSGIPQTGYTDLVVKTSLRETGTSSVFGITFNGNTSSYSTRRLNGTGSSTGSTSSSGAAAIDGIVLPGSDATASTFGSTEFYIPNYTSANYKSVSIDAVTENNATTAYQRLIAGLWSNTAAITSISFATPSEKFVQYSTFYLYGVAKLGTTPAIVPYATGGDTIMTDGTYWYHTFISSGTFTPAKGLSCDVLVVAGGGGGGYFLGGGGGGGGLVYSTAEAAATATNYTVTIGAGGAGGGSGTRGSNGADTSALSYTATGGGGGGSWGNTTSRNGANGGSGGGLGEYSGLGTVGTSTQTSYSGKGFGNSGGSGYASGPDVGVGGGGGAGGAGGNGSSPDTGGVGGIGKYYSISGTSVGYAGGGGATGDNASFLGGTATEGGGAAGNPNGSSGTANRGGGGGGGYANGAGVGTGGAGGSGVVIVRYAV